MTTTPSREGRSRRPPLIVCGPMRCGKTTLCRVLERSGDVALWSEPNALWRTGHAYRTTDVADRRDARPRVARRMRRLTAVYEAANDGRRVLMEGPAACLKIGFLAAVYPDARFVLIVGDGRSSLAARLAMDRPGWMHSLDDPRTTARWSEQLRQTPAWEVPAMAPRVAAGLLRRYVTKAPPRWVGLRYPGWREDRGRLSRAQLAARQWAACVEHARRGLAALPAERSMQLRIEDCFDDLAPVRRLLEFAEIEPGATLLDAARERLAKLAADAAASRLAPEALAEVQPIMAPGLRALGYLPPA